MSKILLISGSGDLPKAIYSSIEAKNNLANSKQKTELMIAEVKNNQGICLNEGFFKERATEYHQFAITDVKAFFELANRLKPDSIIIAGNVDKPDFKDLGLKDNSKSFGAKIAKKLLASRLFGDDLLLRTVIKKIEAGTGVKVVQVSKLLPHMLAGSGLNTCNQPNAMQKLSIAKGFKMLKKLSGLDVSQSMVIDDTKVLGIEAAEGTDALIKRCPSYQTNTGTAILLKDAKVKQTLKADIPTIGIETARLIVQQNYAGIAIKKGRVIVLNQAEFKQIMEQNNKFIYVA